MQNPSELKELSSKITDKYYLFLEVFKMWIWRALILASCIQLCVFFSQECLVAVACVLFAWKLVAFSIFKFEIIFKYTLSSLVIIGFVLTQFCLPLIFTLFEGKSIVYNLNFPIQVFFHSTIAIIVLILSHFLYRHLDNTLGFVRYKIQTRFQRIGLFTAPNNYQVWTMGLIGLGALLITYFTGNRYGISN